MKVTHLLVLLLCCVASCKKDPCDDHSNYYPIEDVSKPYLFKKGTYWIYQNSITGVVDSEYISRVETYLDTFFYMKYTCGKNYSIHSVYEMTHKNTEAPKDSITWFCGGGITSPLIGVEKNGNRNVVLLLTNKDIKDSERCLFYKGEFNNLTINNHIFNSVDCYTVTGDSVQCKSIFDYTTDFYFAPHFGLIKKVEYNTPNGTQQWNLIRWNIVQ